MTTPIPVVQRLAAAVDEYARTYRVRTGRAPDILILAGAHTLTEALLEAERSAPWYAEQHDGMYRVTYRGWHLWPCPAVRADGYRVVLLSTPGMLDLLPPHCTPPQETT